MSEMWAYEAPAKVLREKTDGIRRGKRWTTTWLVKGPIVSFGCPSG